MTLHDALSGAGVHGAYFFEEVRRSLVDRFDIDRVYSGGLRVYSTIDPKMQTAADEAVRASLAELDAERPSSKDDKDAASRSAEPLQAARGCLMTATSTSPQSTSATRFVFPVTAPPSACCSRSGFRTWSRWLTPLVSKSNPLCRRWPSGPAR